MRDVRNRAVSSLGERDLIVALRASIPIDRGDINKAPEKEKERIIHAADMIMNNVFNYLGSGEVVLNPVCWDSDFISGYRWESGLYYKKYVQVDLGNHADVKVPRELSRCHFLLHLSLAYVFTSDEKYAKKAVSLIEDWIDNNPFLYSINWCCAMDVAIRVVNWIWAIALLKDYTIEKGQSDKISESIYQHGWFIFRNLEGSKLSYNGNHYYSDLVGLLHIGLLFKKDAEGNFWYDFAKKELFREMRAQILPSGMHYENSTNYHRLVLELTLPCLAILKKNNHIIPPDITARLKAMFEIVELLVLPNGEMPIIGDQDNGRCLPVGVEKVNDYRYLLELSSYLYNQAPYSTIYCSIFRDLKTNEYCHLKVQEKKKQLLLIKDAGFAIYKDSSWYCLVNVDNQGLYRDYTNCNGHTHADWFSFVLAYCGVPFIIDPGSFVYSSSPEERNLYRSTLMHNTAMVDGVNQASIPKTELWSLPRKGKVLVREVSDDDNKWVVDCEHDAFSSQKETIIHQRSISLDKGKNALIIDDIISSREEHHIDIYFHLAPEVHVINKDGVLTLENEGKILKMSSSSSNALSINIESCSISKGYGNKQLSTCLHLSISSRVKSIIHTVIQG